MKSKIILDLGLLEQEVFDNFCYYYQCEFVTEIENPLYGDMKEKIMLRMQKNDFQINESLTFQAEILGLSTSIPFKPAQIFELLSQVNLLRQEMERLKLTFCKKCYSDILMAYVDLLGGELYLIQNSAIERQAKAIRAVKVRYEKKLYPRREILYRVLREQVVQRGRKWDNLNQAVTSIIPVLLKEFEQYDIDWVRSQITLKQDELEKLEQDATPLAEPFSEYEIRRKKVSPAVKAKKANKIQDELKKLNSILHSKKTSVMLKDLGYNMPYNNTDYMEETIINELRNQPEILKEILLNVC